MAIPLTYLFQLLTMRMYISTGFLVMSENTYFKISYWQQVSPNICCPINEEYSHHIETNRLIFRANQLNGFYMIKRLADWSLTLFFTKTYQEVTKSLFLKYGTNYLRMDQPFKNLKGYGLPEGDHSASKSLKAVFHKFYLVRSWIFCPICSYEKITKFL